MSIFDAGINEKSIIDPSFKEDSVREEIISPILKQLGYSSFSENKIIRSKKLEHPYVQFGTRKEHISIIPDYLLQVSDKKVFILDAKAPNEDILKGKNLEQAFSYAIHREIKVEKYGLCNGLELAIFDIDKVDPVLYLKFHEIEEKWQEVVKVISPLAFQKPYIFNYKPDYGIWCIKSGVNPDMKHSFYDAGIGTIGKVDNYTYTFTLIIPFERECIASFDFNQSQFDDFIKQVPINKKVSVLNALTKAPFIYAIEKEEDSFRVSFVAILAKQIEKNEDESFLPLKVLKFL